MSGDVSVFDDGPGAARQVARAVAVADSKSATAIHKPNTCVLPVEGGLPVERGLSAGMGIGLGGVSWKFRACGAKIPRSPPN